jgi:hypothetical protein
VAPETSRITPPRKLVTAKARHHARAHSRRSGHPPHALTPLEKLVKAENDGRDGKGHHVVRDPEREKRAQHGCSGERGSEKEQHDALEYPESAGDLARHPHDLRKQERSQEAGTGFVERHRELQVANPNGLLRLKLHEESRDDQQEKDATGLALKKAHAGRAERQRRGATPPRQREEPEPKTRSTRSPS